MHVHSRGLRSSKKCPLIKKKSITYVLFVPGSNFVFLWENPVMHYRKTCQGIHFFLVRDCKAGRHRRSSSKATAGISGKFSSWTTRNYEKFCWQTLDQLQNSKAHEMQKIPPNIQNMRLPEMPFKYPLEYKKNTKVVFLGYFSGIFVGVFFRSPAVGGICMSGWYFWPILGFVGFSAL